MPHFIVGKSKKSRCFRGVKSLLVKYEANSNAWMIASLFQNWLVSFDNEMNKMKRKAILFLDNFCVHKVNLRLENVSLHFCLQTQQLFYSQWTRELYHCLRGIIENKSLKKSWPA